MNSTNRNIVFLLPVYNDFGSLKIVIQELSRYASQQNEILSFEFLVIDDCSSPENRKTFKVNAKAMNVKIIKTNMRSGSQKAILMGLTYLSKTKSRSQIVVLDSDGEDKPEDAVALAVKIISYKSEEIIQVQRGVRFSSILFKLAYFLYQNLFRFLVGKKNPPGNFMALPNSQIKNVLSFPGVDKHIAGSILRYASNIQNVRFNRGKRIEGSSKMNLSSLFVHANGSLSVFADVIFTRIVFFIFLILSLMTFFGFGLLTLKIFGLSFLGWYPTLVGWTSLSLLLVFSSVFIVGCNVILLLLLMLKLDR